MTIRPVLACKTVTGWWVGAPAVAGMAALVAATDKGLYVSPDSVFYVGTARNLLDGVGFRPPPGLPALGHFPPLFTLVIAAVGRLGVDPLDAARVVNVAVLGATVFLVGMVLRSLTGSVAAAVVGAALTAAAVDVLTFSAAALSEPLFVLLALAGLVALAAHLDRPRPVLLLAAAGSVALAVLTRYVGVALVVTGVGVLLWRGRDRSWHGVVDAATFGAVALAPALVWLAWAGRAAGVAGAGERTVAFHPFGAAYLAQAPRPLARWIIAWPGPPAGPVLALVLAAAAVAFVRRRGGGALGTVPSAPGSLPLVLGVFSASYLAVLVANRVLIDATGRLDARFLMPLHVVALLAVVPVVYRLRSRRGVVIAAWALVLSQVAGGLVWAAEGLTDESIPRRGYTARAWRDSALVSLVATADPALPVYTNGFDVLFLLTGRAGRPIPAAKDYLTDRTNTRFPFELAAMGADLERTGGLLVYFDALTARRSFLPSRQELERALPLDVVATDAVGRIYRVRR